MHIATKFKAKFCKISALFRMGDRSASVAHLHHLLNTVPKVQHGLCLTDLDNTDKMNYKSFVKITDDRVLEALKNVPESEATQALLELMHDFIFAFVDPNLSAELRVKKAMRALFFMRIWRAWLVEEGYDLHEAFLTENTFMCMELNVHALIKVIRCLREIGRSDLLLTTRLSSQSCEQLFRAARSLTSTFATIVNFSMYDLLGRLRRIELLTRIAAALQGDYRFPR